MILGRNTAQWTGFITALTGFLGIVVPVLFPNLDPVQVGVVLGAITAFLGAFIAFLANDQLTPVSDPRLPIGTRVNVGYDGAATGVVTPESAGLDAVPVDAKVVEAPAVVVDGPNP